ncbi:histone-lysine N-methyltransferase EHMT2 isoform X1 [Schistocerca americana]|uniref:histone-lysine N-methyltransferase EHMT2 isoform X1 n=1 Tax=Schistocerca americana TaxID=7009 RepID=UPI001F502F1A|nr:histone-lysine N-methyltransferase EHMT2 isoform X1 [Schistocerca americana]
MKVTTNAHTAPATIITAIATSTRSSTKPTVSAVNVRSTSNSSTFSTCSSTTTPYRNGSACIDSPPPAAVNPRVTTLCHNHVKGDKGNKSLQCSESTFVPIITVAAKPAGGIRMKTEDVTHKDDSHAGGKNNQTEKLVKRQQPKTTKISDNSKFVTDKPMTCTSVVTSYSAAKSSDSSSPGMTLHKHQDKGASCASNLPCASESPAVLTPVCAAPLDSNMETSNSGLPKPKAPVLETPIKESATSVQNQGESVEPSTVNVSSQGSAEPVLNAQNEEPSLTIEEELFDDCSEKSEEITLLNKIEKVASDAEDNAPRLLITLKPGEAGGESILSWKGCREVIGNDGVWSVANVETVDDNVENTTVKGKRSLRSKVPQKPVPEPEVVGVKRSARRRSRDYHCETVLQSAIARKEKSFSSLVQYDERAAANRISRQNMKSAAGKRAAAEAKKLRGKGAKAAQKNLTTQEQLKNLINLNKARKSDIQTRTVTRSQLFSSFGITSPVYNEISMDICSQRTSNLSMNSSAQTYTKTGKRRYKPYKGLRYSLSSNNAKKNKLTRHQRTLSDADGAGNEIVGRPMVARKSDRSQTLKGFETGTYALAAEDFSLFRSGPPNLPRSMKNSRVADVYVYESDCESDISSIIDVGSPEIKREILSDDDGGGGDVEEEEDEDEEKYTDFKRKRFCYDKSSLPPQRGRRKLHTGRGGELSDDDVMSQPIPEVSTSSSKGTADGILCYCQKSTSLYAAIQSQKTSVMYCQAMDALDEHVIGCAEVVQVKNVCLRRAGVRCPFVLLCEVHKQRLLRHMCCPGCGIFCTQGNFVMCNGKHFYHRECQVTKGGVLSCPHCGEVSPPVDCTLTLSTLKTPVYLPELKPPRKESTARMTVKESSRKNIIEEREKGMTLPLDKEKLTQLVNTACSMQVVSEQEINTSRSMEETLFIAAKTGNAEKILQALASGIAANHAFEEANMGSALHIAASEGNLAAVHILLQSGAQIDLMDQDQNTPLILAAQAGRNAIVEYLIKAGASVTLKGGDGMTALHVAAKTGNLEACQYLLSVPNTKNNFVDTIDDGGWTPLVWATENCHADVARFLLKKRADPHIRDVEQNIALHWSAFSGCMDVSEMLINYGSEVNSVNIHGDTPLHVGARQDKYDCVLMLLSRGARVDVVNSAGNSPLDCCVKRSNECYTAIKLNILLGNVVLNVREPSEKILSNDISRGREMNPIQCVNGEDDEEEPSDYTYVSKNCLTANISIDTAVTSLQSCLCTDNCSSNRCTCTFMSEQCWYDDEGKLVPEFNYTDAPMIFECNQCCGCNQSTCNNRVVQHGFTGRFQLFRTQRRGWGVRTLTAISKGSFVCEYIGEIITDCEADNRDDDTYLFDLDNRRRHFGHNSVNERKNSVELVSCSLNPQERLGKTPHDGETYCIDARYYGNISRFINHMCAPNLLAIRVFVEHQDVHFPRMAFFANRDIEPNEELGFDYGDKFWAVKCKSFTCSCGAENCKYSESTFRKTLNLSGASEQ